MQSNKTLNISSALALAYRHYMPALTLIALSLAACAPQCRKNSDCLALAQGKSCIPVEYLCEAGECKSRCAHTCRTDSSDVNSCDSGSICSDPSSSTWGFPICTSAPIACGSPSDCPLYRPRDSSGVQHEWTCADGVCSYEGLDYIRGSP
jgi:hypothetical protein